MRKPEKACVTRPVGKSRSKPITFTPILGPNYGPNEEARIRQLDKFLRQMRNGVLPLVHILDDWDSRYSSMQDYAFFRIAGRSYVMPARSSHIIIKTDPDEEPVFEIYSIVRYAKTKDHMVVRGPLRWTALLKKSVKRVLDLYYEDDYGEKVLEKMHNECLRPPTPAPPVPSA